MKSDEVKLEQDLNRQIWSRGKTNPPRKVRVKMVKDEDGVVTVSLYEDLPATSEASAVEEKKPEASPAETAPAGEEPKTAEANHLS
jgi:large subunit ribosomal protein L31e